MAHQPSHARFWDRIRVFWEGQTSQLLIPDLWQTRAAAQTRWPLTRVPAPTPSRALMAAQSGAQPWSRCLSPWRLFWGPDRQMESSVLRFVFMRELSFTAVWINKKYCLVVSWHGLLAIYAQLPEHWLFLFICLSFYKNVYFYYDITMTQWRPARASQAFPAGLNIIRIYI